MDMNISLKTPFYIISVVSLLLTGCKKEIDFKYNDIAPVLVIEGALTQYGAEVSVTFTTPMDEPISGKRITDAKVSLTDLSTGNDYTLTPDDEGLYVSPTGGVEGHEYRLTVEREGCVYRADCLMREKTEITGMEFSWIKMPYDYVAVLQVSFTDNPLTNNDCYWMRLYRNGEIYKWAEINDLLSHDGIVDEAMMTSRKDLDEEDEGDRLEKGDKVRATVVPISREMHGYLEALSIGNSNGPRMFEGDFCLGYFLAAPITEKEIVFPGFDE